MNRRERDLLWLRDVLEHLRDCHQQLQWTEDGESVRVITETMIRDLDRCRRICETLQVRPGLPGAA
jgi:hypothetical protein